VIREDRKSGRALFSPIRHCRIELLLLPFSSSTGVTLAPNLGSQEEGTIKVGNLKAALPGASASVRCSDLPGTPPSETASPTSLQPTTFLCHSSLIVTATPSFELSFLSDSELGRREPSNFLDSVRYLSSDSWQHSGRLELRAALHVCPSPSPSHPVRFQQQLPIFHITAASLLPTWRRTGNPRASGLCNN
jgi:hypothetical protein